MSDILFKAGVDGNEWRQSLQQTQQSLTDAVGRMTAAFGPLSDSVKGFGSVFETLAAPIARIQGLFAGLVTIVGGAAFKVGIDESRQLTGEAMKLANVLGIATDKASALNTALGDIGTDSETYLGAFNHFAKALKANEEAFQAMGLKTRDANGNLRDASTLMQEAMADVNQYQRGLDQTTAAMTYFGKGIEDVRKLQKLNAEVIEEARQKNEQLGLTITKNNVEATRKYRNAMNDLGDVMSALKKQIGDAMMPIFASLANWLSSIGPAAVMVMHGAVATLASIFWIAKSAVVALWETLGAFLYTITEPFLSFGRAFSMIIRGEWKGAVEELGGLAGRIGGVWKNAWQAYATDAKKSFDEIKKVWSDQSGAFTPSSGSKKMPSFVKPDKDKEAASRVPEWEEVLNNWKLAYQQMSIEQGQFHQLSKAQEAEYWRNVLATQSMTDKERQAVTKKYVEAEGESQKQRFAAEIATLRAQEVEWQANAERRLAIVRETSARILAVYGAESKEYQEARRREAETERAVAEQRRNLALLAGKEVADSRLAEVDAAQRAYQATATLYGQSIQQQLAMDLAFEEQRYLIRQQYARMALESADPEKDPVRYAQLKNQLLEIERQYHTKRQEITLGAQERLAEPARNMFDGMQSALNSSLKGMLNGTQTWAQATMRLFGAVGDVLIEELITKPIAMQAVAVIKRMAMSNAVIGAKAGEAGAAAAASAAETPFIGWTMALPAMAAVFAGVMALRGSIHSAAGGWDIPSGINPVAQLHQNEMVLDAGSAGVIREMRDGSRSMGGGNTNIYAMDSRSFEDFFRDKREVAARVLHGAMRDGWRDR